MFYMCWAVFFIYLYLHVLWLYFTVCLLLYYIWFCLHADSICNRFAFTQLLTTPKAFWCRFPCFVSFLILFATCSFGDTFLNSCVWTLSYAGVSVTKKQLSWDTFALFACLFSVSITRNVQLAGNCFQHANLRFLTPTAFLCSCRWVCLGRTFLIDSG